MNTFGDRLRIIRGKQSQADFSAILGIPQVTLGNYERGRNQPRFELIEKICSLFEINVSWLLFGKGAMHLDDIRSPLLHSESSQVSAPEAACTCCTKLENKLEKLELQRDEVVAENRQLHRDKEALLRENGELREKVARLEERKRRDELTHGFPAESSKVGS